MVQSIDLMHLPPKCFMGIEDSLQQTEKRTFLIEKFLELMEGLYRAFKKTKDVVFQRFHLNVISEDMDFLFYTFFDIREPKDFSSTQM